MLSPEDPLLLQFPIGPDAAERLGGADGPEATGLRSITGSGVEASVEGEAVHIGKDDFFDGFPASCCRTRCGAPSSGSKRTAAPR